MNRLPEVKRFIKFDLPLYHNIKFKEVPGANPELVLLNKNGETLQRIDLSSFDQLRLNQLFKGKGFFKKDDSATEIPEHMLEGPYGDPVPIAGQQKDKEDL